MNRHAVEVVRGLPLYTVLTGHALQGRLTWAHLECRQSFSNPAGPPSAEPPWPHPCLIECKAQQGRNNANVFTRITSPNSIPSNVQEVG